VHAVVAPLLQQYVHRLCSATYGSKPWLGLGLGLGLGSGLGLGLGLLIGGVRACLIAVGMHHARYGFAEGDVAPDDPLHGLAALGAQLRVQARLHAEGLTKIPADAPSISLKAGVHLTVGCDSAVVQLITLLLLSSSPRSNVAWPHREDSADASLRGDRPSEPKSSYRLTHMVIAADSQTGVPS